jgi:hypothetical protein
VSPDAVAVDWAGRVGQVTHRLVCDLAPLARSLDPWELGERALRGARSLVRDGQVLRAPAARARAAGLALSYLRDFVPGGDWMLLGTEYVLPSSRVDLAWEHPVHGVLLDEIKSFRGRGLGGLTAADLTQAEKHASGGDTVFGDRFLGVRILTLGGLHTAIAVLPTAGTVPLVGSGLHPAELVGGAR